MSQYRIIGGDGKEYGPKSEQDVRDWISQGRLNSQSQIRLEGSDDWMAIGQLAEFQADLNPGAPPPDSPAPGYQPGSAPQYPPQQAAYYTHAHLQQRPNNTMAVVGLVMGIASLVTSCCCYGLPFNLLGIIFSCIALKQIGDNPHQEGKPLAIAGLATSAVSMLLALAMLALGIASAVVSP